MGKMKELAMYLDDFFKILTGMAKDIHDIAEYVRKQEQKENRTIRKQQDRKENAKWGRLI